jgi:hypothetical protein
MAVRSDGTERPGCFQNHALSAAKLMPLNANLDPFKDTKGWAHLML